MEWQPIETAPKDGTRVDLWLPEFGGYRVTNARWDRPVSRWTNGDRYGPWGWQYDGEESGYIRPTHWMRLPEPPAHQQPIPNPADPEQPTSP